MSTLTNLLTKVYTETGLDNGNETLVTQAINETQREINDLKFIFLETTGSFTLSTGTTEQDTDLSDVLEIIKVKVDDTNAWHDLIEGTYESIVQGDVSGFGIPKYWAKKGLSGGTLWLYIGSPQTDLTYTASVTYYKKLADLSDGADESLISQEYNDSPLIKGAITKAYRATEQVSLADATLPAYQEEIALMKQTMPWRRW